MSYTSSDETVQTKFRVRNPLTAQSSVHATNSLSYHFHTEMKIISTLGYAMLLVVLSSGNNIIYNNF